MQTNNTIVAVSTPAGKGGIGIIRLSGPESLPIARMLFRPLSGKAWQPVQRMLTLGWAYDQDNNALDQVLAVYFAAPKSYTTEDVVEIHAHGAPATLRHIERLCLQYGARLAQAGEFTLRAFMGGRLDLSQAEAVGQLIQARSEQEASLAILNLQGGLGDRLSAIRAALLALSAQVEAWIDFPEEQDEVDVAAFLSDIEAALVQPVEKLLHERQRGRILREGALLILCGRPNVGKSSLFNALLGREKALVSPHPGTTRDGLQDEAVIQGIVCRLQDTAGLGDEAAEAGSVGLELAQMGQEATRQALREADLLLIVLDSSVPLSEEDKEVLRITETYQRLLLASKTDLPAAWPLADFDGIIPISVRKGDLCNLEKEIAHALFKDAGETAYGRIVVSARQAHQLQDIADTLARTKDLLSLDGAVSWEFVAWELQQCLFSLATLDGQGAPDEVLEEIFSTFCLGK